MSRITDKKTRVMVKTVAFTLLSIVLFMVLSLLVLEMFLRIFTHPSISPGFLRTHPERRYELRPGVEGTTYNARFQINTHGLRGPVRDINPDAIRIAVFGDSITFGIGVEHDALFTSLMEITLNQLFEDREVQVFNFGIPSYNSESEYLYLRDTYDKFRPHLIIVQFGANDVDISSNSKMNKNPIFRLTKDLSRNLYSYDFLATRYFLLRYQIQNRNRKKPETPSGHDLRKFSDDYEGWLRANKAFSQFASFSYSHNVPVVFALYTNNVKLAETIEQDITYTIVDKVSAALKQAGIKHIVYLDNAFREYRGRESKLWVTPTDSHLSPLAHKLIADQLIDVSLRILRDL